MDKDVSVVLFEELVSAIRRELEMGRVQLERNAGQRKTTVMWRMGMLIHTHLLKNKNIAGYGKQLFIRLSEILDIGVRTLYRTVQFYEAYPENLSPVTNFTWSHYLILLSVKDRVKRQEYEKLIIRENISKLQLQKIVKKERNSNAWKTETLIRKTVRSKPGIFRIKIIDNIPHIDCGFHNYLEYPDISNIKTEDTYIEVSKTGINIIEPDKNLLYTFKAKIYEFIDGDTVKVELDTGIGLKSRRVLRLRGINTAPLHTEAGQKAKIYIETKLSKLSFVIIKTYSYDKYLRYLADIFYSNEHTNIHYVSQNGTFLNEELVQKGIAEKYWG